MCVWHSKEAKKGGREYLWVLCSQGHILVLSAVAYDVLLLSEEQRGGFLLLPDALVRSSFLVCQKLHRCLFWPVGSRRLNEDQVHMWCVALAVSKPFRFLMYLRYWT